MSGKVKVSCVILWLFYTFIFNGPYASYLLLLSWLLVLCCVIYCFVPQSKTVSGKVQDLSYEGIICIDYLWDWLRNFSHNQNTSDLCIPKRNNNCRHTSFEFMNVFIALHKKKKHNNRNILRQLGSVCISILHRQHCVEQEGNVRFLLRFWSKRTKISDSLHSILCPGL